MGWRKYFGKLEDGRYWAIYCNSVVVIEYDKSRKSTRIRSLGTIFNIYADKDKFNSLPKPVRDYVEKLVKEKIADMERRLRELKRRLGLE